MNFSKNASTDAVDSINRILADMGVGFGSTRVRRKKSLIWWRPPKDWTGNIYIFGYTPWKTKHDGKVGFFTLKYRKLKNGTLKLKKIVRFGRRKVAKARSLKWYDKYYKKEE